MADLTLDTSAVPNPGSARARLVGCTCARIDNNYDDGYRGQAGVFMLTAGCPLHWPVGRALAKEERS